MPEVAFPCCAMAFQVGDRVRVVRVDTRHHGSALKDRRGVVTACIEPSEGIRHTIYAVDLGDQYRCRYFPEHHLRRDD